MATSRKLSDSSLGGGGNAAKWNSSLEPLRPIKNRVSSALPMRSRQATFPMTLPERPATLPKMRRRRIKSAPIGRPQERPLSENSDVVYCDLLKRRLDASDQVPRILPGVPSQRRFGVGGWMLSQEENEETSDDEWDELLFEIDEESYWNKKLGKLLIITQIPLHLKTRADKLEWLKRHFRSQTGGSGRGKQRPTTAQLERLLDSYESKHGQDQNGDDRDQSSTTHRKRRKNRNGFLEAVDEGDESEFESDESGDDDSYLFDITQGFGGDGNHSDDSCSKCGSHLGQGQKADVESSGNDTGTEPTDMNHGTYTGTGTAGGLSGTGKDSNGFWNEDPTGHHDTGIGISSGDGIYGYEGSSGGGDIMREILNRKKGGDLLTTSHSSMASAFSAVSRRSRRSDLTNTAQGFGLRGGTELNELASIKGTGSIDDDKMQFNGTDGSLGHGQLNNSSGLGHGNSSQGKGLGSKRRLKPIDPEKLSSSNSRVTDFGGKKDHDDQSHQLQSPSSSGLSQKSHSSLATGPPPHTRPESFSSEPDMQHGQLAGHENSPISGSPKVGSNGFKFPLRKGKKPFRLPDLYSLGITRAFTYSYFTLPAQYQEDNDHWSRIAWNRGNQSKKT